MDFSKVSFDAAWTDDKAEMESNKNKAIVYLALFAFTSTNLIISIIRTITTNPGNIPDHKEWDMSTDTSGGEEAGSLISRSNENEEKKTTGGEQGGNEPFTNQLIEKSKKEPREVVHEDFKYIPTTEGPLVSAPNS